MSSFNFPQELLITIFLKEFLLFTILNTVPIVKEFLTINIVFFENATVDWEVKYTYTVFY